MPTEDLENHGPTVIPCSRASFSLVKALGGESLWLRSSEEGIAVRRGDGFPVLGPERFRGMVRDSGTRRALTRTLAQLTVT